MSYSGPMPGDVWVRVSDPREDHRRGFPITSVSNGVYSETVPFIVTWLGVENLQYTSIYCAGKQEGTIRLRGLDWHAHFARIWPAPEEPPLP